MFISDRQTEASSGDTCDQSWIPPAFEAKLFEDSRRRLWKYRHHTILIGTSRSPATQGVTPPSFCVGLAGFHRVIAAGALRIDNGILQSFDSERPVVAEDVRLPKKTHRDGVLFERDRQISRCFDDISQSKGLGFLCGSSFIPNHFDLYSPQ